MISYRFATWKGYCCFVACSMTLLVVAFTWPWWRLSEQIEHARATPAAKMPEATVMPSECVAPDDRPRLVGNLNVGQTGYVIATFVDLDNDGRAWLLVAAKLHPKGTVGSVEVRLESRGWVLIAPKGNKWKLGSKEGRLTYAPIVEVILND